VKKGKKLKPAFFCLLPGRRRISTFLIYLLFVPFIFSQGRKEYNYRFMFYNVENFFDVHDDSLRDDGDFLPGGAMKWNQTRYDRKLNSIYKVIVAAGGWSPPAVVGFCEVENRKVLEDITGKTYLSKYDYGIIHEDSNDPRGIDVCLIYRKDLIDVEFYDYIIPGGYHPSEYKTRSVLYVKMLISGNTVHLFLNHWPSRRGGVLAGEPLRLSVSRLVKTKTDSIQRAENGLSRIIVAGDFNAVPSDQVILDLTGGREDGNDITPYLVNLSEGLSENGLGTYKYRGMWEMIDQVIVSVALLDPGNGIHTDPDLLTIFKPDFLLRTDKSYPGMTTNPTYLGYKYLGGYSDHLPVLIDLKIDRDL
jgi:hypothetical protein